MSVNLFFEYFYEESRELLRDIARLAYGLRSVDIPDDRQQQVFVDCIQKLQRLIGGMASIGFEMYSSVSHKMTLLAQSCAAAENHSIQKAIAEIIIILTDLTVYFTSTDKVKDIEGIAPRIEKGIDSCMECFRVKKATINSQSEIDDIMKMFGKV